MGHGNGMTYANGYLFVAAYDRAINRNEIAQLDPATGNLVETYQCEHTIGGISYYGYDSQRDKDLFIVVNYDYSSSKPYAENPEFLLVIWSPVNLQVSKISAHRILPLKTAHRKMFCRIFFILHHMAYSM